MKKIVSLFTVLFFLAAILVTGCKKEEQVVSPQSPTAKTEQDVKFESFAKSLAKSLNDASNLSTLKSKISETFDGDYDVLYAQLRYNSLKSSSRLVQNIENDLSISTEELLNEVPLLNISVPHISNDANINTLSASPWVVYVPENFQEGVTKYLIGFNAQGESKKFDAVTPPNEAVVVVGRNERVIAVEKGKKAAVKGDRVADVTGGSYDYFMIEPIGGVSGGGSSSGSGSSGSGSSTTNTGNQCQLKGFMFTNLNAYESWVLGGPEIRLKVYPYDVYLNNQNAPDLYSWNPSRKEVKNTWKYVTQNIYNFDYFPYKDAQGVVLFWYEYDGGGVKYYDIPVEFKGIKVTLKIPYGSDDDIMGSKALGNDYHIDDTFSTGEFKYKLHFL